MASFSCDLLYFMNHIKNKVKINEYEPFDALNLELIPKYSTFIPLRGAVKSKFKNMGIFKYVLDLQTSDFIKNGYTN